MPESSKIGLFEKWWLLRHSSPKMLNQQLGVLNEQRVSRGQPEIVYLIPHQVTDELRSTMYHYLFIRASEGDIRGLVHGDWNRSLPARLHLCYDRSGVPLWASQKEMDKLVALMIEYREVLDVVPSEAQFEEGDTLQVKLDMFHGYDFAVRSFSGADKGANLILELPLCNGRLTLRTKSVFVSDDYLPKEMRKLLSADDIRAMERELIAIAARRYMPRKTKPGPAADRGGTDDTNLNNFHYLNYMQLGDSAEHRHIRVLLLLCAALRKDRRTVEALAPVIAAQLSAPLRGGMTEEQGGVVLTSDEEAFAACVLYIATHDAAWRNAAKQYQQARRPLSESLLLLLPVVRSIHFRTPKAKLDKVLRKTLSERVRKTVQYIRDCDVATLTPESVKSIFDILALPPYDTDEGRRVRAAFNQKAAALIPSSLCGIEALQESTAAEPAAAANSSLKSSRTRLRTLLRPAAADLETHYRLLRRVFPDRSQSDAHDYYVEFITLLRNLYKAEPPLSPSWWRMKALLEHYHTAAK